MKHSLQSETDIKRAKYDEMYEGSEQHDGDTIHGTEGLPAMLDMMRPLNVKLQGHLGVLTVECSCSPSGGDVKCLQCDLM